MTGLEPLPYQWLLLRCVPRIERGECLNVGVILHCQAADTLLFASHLDTQRLRALSPGFDVETLAVALNLVAEVCAGRTGGGRPDLPTPGKRFGWLAAPRSTVLQPGPVHGGLTSDPQAEVERLLDRYVR